MFMDIRALSYPYLKSHLDQNIGVQLVVEAWDSYPNLWALANGSRDYELKDFFSKLKEDGRHVTIRLLHEHNSVWYPWGLYYGGSNSKDAYLSAFRHMVSVIRSTGANVSIQQAYNSNTVGGSDSYESMYVGDQWCDEVTVSTYNFCGAHGDTIQYIDNIITPWYNAMSINSKPLGISEIGTTGHCGVDKPAWIRDAFNKLAVEFPRINTMNWFFEDKSNNEDLDLHAQQEFNAFRDSVYMWKSMTGTAAAGDQMPPPSVEDQNDLAMAEKAYQDELKQKGLTQPDVVKTNADAGAVHLQMNP
jgi:hypothetical protein